MRTKGALTVSIIALAVSTPVSAQAPVTDRNQIANPLMLDWSVAGPNNKNLGTVFTLALGFAHLTASTQPNQFFLRLDAGNGWNGGFANGDAVLLGYGASRMSFTFSNPIFGFATQLWFRQSYIGGDLRVTEYRNGQQVGHWGSFAPGGTAANGNQAPTVGVIDAGGFDRIDIEGSGTILNGEFGINQLTLDPGSTAFAPEPASLVLLATGLAASAWIPRRRRRVNDEPPERAK